MAVWEWEDHSQSWSPWTSSDNSNANLSIQVEQPWSMQRVIVFGGMNAWSTDAGSAIGNPIYSTIYCNFQVRASQPDKGTNNLLVRRTYCNFQEQATVATPNIDRRGIWWLPHDFFEFDARVRAEGSDFSTAISVNAGLTGEGNGPNQIGPTGIQGSIYVRLLKSRA